MDGESIGLYNNSITSLTAGVVYNASFSALFNARNVTLPTSPPSSQLASPLHFSLLYQIIASIFGSLIFVIGFIGNILVIVVVIRTKAMHTPTNCYLLSLAVADIIVLLSATLPSVPEPFFMIEEWPFGRTMCSIIVFLQYLGVNASSLSIGAFTVERYIAICYPMKAQTICTVRRAKRIIVVIWTFLLLYCVPWLALTTIKMKQFKGGRKYETCTFRLKREQYQTYYMIDLVIFYAVPLIVAAILYGLIARILFSSTIPKSQGGAINEGKKDPRRKQSSSRVQVIRMLVVIVGVFATLWLPYRAMVVYNSFASTRYLDLWFLLFCRTMVYVNSAINPILYNVMSMKFRRAFRKALFCGKVQRGFDPAFNSTFCTAHCNEKRPNENTMTTDLRVSVDLTNNSNHRIKKASP